jgi:UDP-2,3-diacylglucosamine hydrolase
MSAPPAIGRFAAPAGWRAIDFISDLHLRPDHPRTFAAWQRHLLQTPADAVFILGDLFEVWVGDDARADGFDHACAEVLRQASASRHIAFLSGNRDFLVGADLAADCGMHLLQDPTLLCAWDHRLLLSHGDALCLGDVAYQQFRQQVRNTAWQQAFLARPLAERRHIAQGLRDGSEAIKARQRQGEWVDIDAAEAVAWLKAADAVELVHGHTHQPGRGELAPGMHREVLSDWELDDGIAPRGDVLRLTHEGLTRLTLDQALLADA